jgi:RNA polymerase sigma-70 factor (ECF subfamily)
VDAHLERLFDSMDICQSVLGSFFVRAAAGQYELDKPQQLLKLLVTMARNKLADAARKQSAECRDRRRVRDDALDAEGLVDDSSTPSERLAGRELLDEFRQRLSEEERQLADRRALGRDWPAIAAELGGSPESRASGHRLTVLSWLAVANHRPSVEKATPFTGPVCPRRVACSVPVATSHSFTVRS